MRSNYVELLLKNHTYRGFPIINNDDDAILIGYISRFQLQLALGNYHSINTNTLLIFKQKKTKIFINILETVTVIFLLYNFRIHQYMQILDHGWTSHHLHCLRKAVYN